MAFATSEILDTMMLGISIGENEMSDQKPKDHKDEDVTFDMYHFFSRKDVIALVIMILLLLAYVLYQAFFGAEII